MTVCPGCGGKKSRNAQLCATCRRTANAVGADVVTHVEGVIPPESRPPRPRTPQQNVVYHARITDLAKLAQPPNKDALRDHERRLKKATLTKASDMFKRPVKSSTELTEVEMEILLDWLDEQLEEAKTNLPHLVAAS